MALLTATEMRTHVETDLVDAALQRLLDDAEKAIDAKVGPVSATVAEFAATELAIELWVAQAIATITSVVEEDKTGGGYTSTTLASDDYKVRNNGRSIERLGDGTNPGTYWSDRVTITYTAATDTARREVAQIDLVKLELAFSGYDTERAGDWTGVVKDHEKNRRGVLRRLRTWNMA